MTHHNTIVGLGQPVPEARHRCCFSLRCSLTRYNRLLLRNGLLKVVEVQPVFNSVFPIMWYRLMKTIAVTSLIMLDICLYILINPVPLWFTNSLWQFCMNCITLRSCGYGSQQKRHTKATWIMSNLTGTSWITPGNIKTSTLPTGCPHLWLYKMTHHNTIVGLGRPVPEPKHRCYFSLRRSLTRYNRLLLRNGLLKVFEVQPVFISFFPLMWYRLMKTSYN